MKKSVCVLIVFLSFFLRLAVADEAVEFDDVALDLYKKGRLFDKKLYPALRKAYAVSFAKEHDAVIRKAWGDESEPFRKFMEERDTIREMLFLSLNTEKGGDNVPAALGLMKTIWEKYPLEFETYPALAIAVSLVWDNPRGAIHSSPVGQHKALDPPEEADALANFYYYSNVDKTMGDRIRFMPWEFLALLVNHKTPLSERKWALSKYIGKRKGIGQIYKEVPYDTLMYTKKGEPQLSGLPMTLANQLLYGGVCSCQADFSARVAKSIGVPAYYVAGQNRHGEWHAWVMWIEIDEISAAGMKCSLQSEGRYFNDNYYVGNTPDPPRSVSVTDRELAMKLHSIGSDATAYRLSLLALKAFDRISATESLPATKQLDYLGKVIDVNPFAVDAWKRTAAMVRNDEIDKKDAGALKKYPNLLFRHMAAFPDFTWEVFDDLVSFEPWKKQRGENYGKLCAFYETAKRPDLACKARIQYAKYLVEEDRIAEALKGLAATCMMFPEEGTIIPDILDEMDRLCTLVPEKTNANRKAMAAFYKAFLPKIPQKRGKTPSPYCMTLYERGIKLFDDAGDTAAATQYRTDLRTLKMSR